MSNEHAQWLRDFAAANEGDFDPDQIQRLKDAANEIDELIQERDEARVGCALAWANEAVGDNGASLGSFQISRAYWIDALDYDPSIGGEYEDVKDPDYARRVVVAYLSRYIKKSEHWTDERAARLHNGGPNAMRKKSTLKYWREVRARLD